MKKLNIELSDVRMLTLSKVRGIAANNGIVLKRKQEDINLCVEMVEKMIEKLDNDDFKLITGLKKF